MKKWQLFLLLIAFSSYTTQQAARLGILMSKASVLTFEEDIVDVELGNADYYLKIKGKCLLLRAKSKQAQPTTLFVRYGKHKHFYVAEILPDNEAPLQQVIPGQKAVEPARAVSATKQATTDLATIFSPHEGQTYYSYGMRKDGVQVILTNITHEQAVTYLRFFIENNTSLNLNLAHYTFEYVTCLRKFLCFTSKKRKLVDPLAAPAAIELAPNSGDYFVFAIPVYTTNGGLEICFSESGQGEREFQLAIPNKILLKAHRK